MFFYGHSVGQPAKTYVHQLCPVIVYRLEDLSRVMADRNGQREREPKEFMLFAYFDDDDDDESKLDKSNLNLPNGIQ